ncbi:MAG: aminoglycoside phosphotransferase family protein [Alphaproteobacteria bacterium]
MGERRRLIEHFLNAAGWGGAQCVKLAGDASFRHYERITSGGRRAMLMDAPPPREDVRPFLLIAHHLKSLGLSAPAILAEDSTAGLLLLEDFGDDTFSRLLAGGADEAALYRLAVDVLIDLHRRTASEVVPPGVPAYDEALLLAEAALFVDWYLPQVLDAPAPDGLGDSFASCWQELLPLARIVSDTLVLRDFHVDNLMRIGGRSGIEACGLLDFQDAVSGPLSYDLMSLLEDARRDVPAALRDHMRTRYLAAFPDLDPDALALSMAVLGAQRHCKVIGIFTRLCVRDGKPGYLDHIPHVWRLLEAAVAHPALAPLRAWLDRHVPAACRVVPPCRSAA